MKFLLKLLLLISITISSPVYSISIAGIEFADNAIANQYLGSSGYFYNWNPVNDGTSPGPALTDTNPGSYAFSYDENAYIDLSFSNTSIFNGAGDDLAIFFVGSGTHTGNLTLLDTTGSLSFGELTFTGYNFPELWDVNNDGIIDQTDASPIYVSYLDLDLLGINGQFALNNFRLEIGNASAVPALLAGINTVPTTPVPLPASLLLFISGLFTLGFLKKQNI